MVQKRSKQKAAVIISVAFFLSSVAVGVAQMYSAIAQSDPAPVATNEPTLADQEKSYEIVLTREPNNLVALEGLAKTRLELGDFQAAIAPLEMLVKLQPERDDYAKLLAETKQKVTN